eukprot:5736777-Alexandrium_andersonii.AAC.1
MSSGKAASRSGPPAGLQRCFYRLFRRVRGQGRACSGRRVALSCGSRGRGPPRRGVRAGRGRGAI